MLWSCEGLPVQARLGVGSTNGPALMTFASPTETLSSLRCPVSLLAALPGALKHLAVWLHGRRTPLVGLSKYAPPSASVPGVHSRLGRCSEELLSGFFPREVPFQRGRAFGPEMPHSGLVPSLPFLPAPTAFSTWHFSGLLHPETDHGVRQVSGVQVRLAFPPSSGHGLRRSRFRARPVSPKRAGLAGDCDAHRSGSEEPWRRCRGAWKHARFPLAFPIGVTPFGAFPFTEAVLRHPFLPVVPRSPPHPR